MHTKRNKKLLAATVLGAAIALVCVPTGQAGAATAACTWQQSALQLPTGTTVAELYGSDGGQYAVGITGIRGLDDGIVGPHPTFWDNGSPVFRLPGDVPHVRDVNSSGQMAGDTVVNNKFFAVTIARDGTPTTLPANPAWESYSAWLINDHGDVVGSARKNGKFVAVIWPASAPGTYRELPTPDVDYLHLVDVDNQGRFIAQTDGTYDGYVWDANGQDHPLQKAGRYAPLAIRDGHVVGEVNAISDNYAAGEWDDQGTLTRKVKGVLEFTAIGGNGTIGGHHYVGSQRRAALWRDGQVVDPLTAVAAGFQLQWISADERSLIGTLNMKPIKYTCS